MSSNVSDGFTKEQQSYLQGFTLGADVARVVQGLPVLSNMAAPAGTTVRVGGAPVSAAPAIARPEDIHREAQDRFIAEGKKLVAEETAKREKNPFDMWDEMQRNAADGVFPKKTDVFLYKFHGLFHVTPAQNSFMCRMRFAGGALNSHQFRGIARLAEAFGGGFADVTTRANLQIREIGPEDTLHVLTGLQDLGVVIRGSGADNIRNVTASTTAGFDRQELIDTLPLAKEIHHYILNHHEMYGLPRKFNISFDGGGTIATLEDTNDIGFTAVRVPESSATAEVPAGIYFQLCLGGITGHKDFARLTGVLVKPAECVAVAAAIVRVFIKHGDRTDRNKARLKYVLDAWGFEKFLEAVAKELPFPLRRFPLDAVVERPAADRFAHVGFHPQKQIGKFYVGVVLPVGRLTCEQMHAIARIADLYGNGDIRLTVWQNLIIPHIDERDIEAVQAAIEGCGLEWRASSFRGGLIACTGNAGCKFAASNTKAHAMTIANYLEERLELDQPINIHLTGCHHSCAQHYIGDIGLLATKVDVGDEMVEGYHLHVGGGWGNDQAIARELRPSVPFEELPQLVERLVSAYLDQRQSAEQSFADFVRQRDIGALQEFLAGPTPIAISA